MRTPPSLDAIREALRLDPETGFLHWSAPMSGKAVGVRAGYTRGGYVLVTFCGVEYPAHRIAFALVHGRWPVGDIDHINGVRSDNRPQNLREATRSQNIANSGICSRNTSGYKGVSWDAKNNKWMARIGCNGRYRTIGRYATACEAGEAYDRVAVELFGDFAMTNQMMRAA